MKKLGWSTRRKVTPDSRLISFPLTTSITEVISRTPAVWSQVHSHVSTGRCWRKNNKGDVEIALKCQTGVRIPYALFACHYRVSSPCEMPNLELSVQTGRVVVHNTAAIERLCVSDMNSRVCKWKSVFVYDSAPDGSETLTVEGHASRHNEDAGKPFHKSHHLITGQTSSR